VTSADIPRLYLTHYSLSGGQYHLLLQEDCNQLRCWKANWALRFQVVEPPTWNMIRASLVELQRTASARVSIVWTFEIPDRLVQGQMAGLVTADEGDRWEIAATVRLPSGEPTVEQLPFMHPQPWGSADHVYRQNGVGRPAPNPEEKKVKSVPVRPAAKRKIKKIR